jgi:dethiobiotin synthetase
MNDDTDYVVVTGTDTEIGKTLVGAGLARTLVDRGRSVRAVKPVESGMDELEPGEDDGARLADAAAQETPSRALTTLSRPLAPPEAADIDDADLPYDGWIDEVQTIGGQVDTCIVEGAGGLLSPLTWDKSALHIADDLDAGAVVVAPNTLGVLNHTLLTLEVLATAGIPVYGVVFSDRAAVERDESSDKNPDTLRRVTGFERIQTLPRVDGWRDAAAQLDPLADWIDLGPTDSPGAGTMALD